MQIITNLTKCKSENPSNRKQNENLELKERERKKKAERREKHRSSKKTENATSKKDRKLRKETVIVEGKEGLEEGSKDEETKEEEAT